MPNIKVRLKLSGTFQSRSDERTFMKQIEVGIPAFVDNALGSFPGQIKVADITIRGPYGDEDDKTSG